MDRARVREKNTPNLGAAPEQDVVQRDKLDAKGASIRMRMCCWSGIPGRA